MRTALVLAAHGSRVHSAANESLCAIARNIAAMKLFDEVTPAFHHGTPTFETVLDQLAAEEVVVVPVMTSAGYYCDEVLPRELRKNTRFERIRVQQTPPVGTHPRMTDLVGSRAKWLAHAFGMASHRVTLALVGHGTARTPRSRLATEELGAVLASRGEWEQVLTAFLDEAPGVETILSRAYCSDVVVLPFLISAGPHATEDVPSRLRVTPTGRPPFSWEMGGRRVVCDRAIGADERLLGIIVELARSGGRGFRAHSASDGVNPTWTLGVRIAADECAT